MRAKGQAAATLAFIVPAWHRSYVRSHPLGIAVTTGICIAGTTGLLFPHLVSGSAPAEVLPTWMLVVFNSCWMVGGFLAATGLLRGIRNMEVPGLALLAGGLFAYYITVVTLRGVSGMVAGLFICALAVGCAIRAWTLFRYGYEARAVINDSDC